MMSCYLIEIFFKKISVNVALRMLINLYLLMLIHL